jgi:choline dehydrogenase
MNTKQDAQHFDYVIVGGGTAGCILSLRIAAKHPDAAVLLLERGPQSWPEPVSNYSLQHTLLSSEFVEKMPDRSSPTGLSMNAARIIGGGWSVNHCSMIRPSRADLQAWESEAGVDWREEVLLEAMLRMEDDVDLGHLPYHGSGGMVHLQRPYVDGDRLPAAARLILDRGREAGFAWLDDVNAPDGGSVQGACTYPYSVQRGQRVNSATTYLAHALGLKNFTLKVEAPVVRLDLDSPRGIGVIASDGSSYWSERVVLSAGVYGTPRILLSTQRWADTSGNAAGRARGLADLPIGQSLQDHATIVVPLELNPRPEDFGTDFGDGAKLRFRITTSLARTTAPDLEIALTHAVEERSAKLFVRLLEHRGAGEVGLDAAGELTIESRLVSHPDDRAALVEGIEWMLQLLHHPALEGRYSLRSDFRNGMDWMSFVGRSYGTYNHGVGTCRMSSSGSGVVDAGLQVRGVEGLFVADASVLPVLPHANTNYATTIVAEHASVLIP